MYYKENYENITLSKDEHKDGHKDDENNCDCNERMKLFDFFLVVVCIIMLFTIKQPLLSVIIISIVLLLRYAYCNIENSKDTEEEDYTVLPYRFVPHANCSGSFKGHKYTNANPTHYRIRRRTQHPVPQYNH